MYFSFDPEKVLNGLDEQEKKDGYDLQNVEINLRGQKDKLILMVNNDNTLPFEKDDSFVWLSTSGMLFISKSDKKYKKNSSYKITVMATEHAFDVSPTNDQAIKFSSDLQFQILITVGGSSKIIELGQPIGDTIPPKGEKMYQLHLSKSEDNVIISLHSTDHLNQAVKATVYIGSEPFEKLENNEIKYAFSQSTYEISPDVLVSKLCKSQLSCDVFIGLVNEMDQKIDYTLGVRSRQFAVELKEGIQYSDGLNSINEYLNLYMHPSNRDHSLNIHVSSVYGHTTFNVILWKNDKQIPSLQWPFPKSTQPSDLIGYHYNSGIHNSHSITFQSSALDECWPNCIILVSLIYYKGLPNDGIDDQENIPVLSGSLGDKFNILISSIYSDLIINQQLEFTLQSQESKYLYLSLSSIVLDKESILIEMTSLSGKAVIGVMIKDDINNRYPNALNGKNADLVSYSNQMKISQKQLVNLMKKHNLKIDQNPQLVVEVTCVSGSAGKFVLTAMRGNSSVMDLMHGLPQEINLQPKQIRFFKYFHFSDSDFSIKLSREIGFADIALRACKQQKSSTFLSFQECLKSVPEGINQHMAGESASTIHIMRSDERLYCKDCLYVITLIGEESETHAFISVLLQQDFTWLQEGRQIIDSVDKDSINLYRLSVDSDEETFISLQQYTGDVQLFYSYRYSFLLEDFTGPFQVNPVDTFLHLTLRPRQELLDSDESFFPFNKPHFDKVPSFHKNIESKKNAENATNHDMPVYIEDLSDYFFEAEIFLAVVNKRKDIFANYSLIFSAGDEYRYIYDGQVMGSSIPPGKKVTYLYHHFEYEAPARLNIFSHSKNFQIDSLEVSGFHDLMKNRHDYKDVTKDPIVLQKIASHDQSISYALPERNGTYELVLLNDHPTKSLNLSLSMNARDMLLIPLTFRIEHALTAKSINYYEVLAPKKGYITLQTIHCAGEFTIGVSQDYQAFLEREYITQIKSFPGSTHVNIFKVNPGPVFFAISSELDESFYKIRPDFFTSLKSMTHDKITPGNEGIVYHQRKKGGNTEISFSPISCQNCSNDLMSKSRVRYEIVYSTDVEILNVLGKCGANNYFEHDTQNQLHFSQNVDPKSHFGDSFKQKSFSLDMLSTEALKVEINLDDENQVYYISVVASVSNIPGGVFRDLVVFYENSQIDKVQVYVQGEASVYAFLFACILVIIFFCMTTCLFWRRYKSLQIVYDTSQKWRDVEMQKEKQKQADIENDNSTLPERNNNFDSFGLTNSFEEVHNNHPQSNADDFTHPSEQLKDENPFEKIQIRIAPPQPNIKVTKQGYDQLIEDE